MLSAPLARRPVPLVPLTKPLPFPASLIKTIQEFGPFKAQCRERVDVDTKPFPCYREQKEPIDENYPNIPHGLKRCDEHRLYENVTYGPGYKRAYLVVEPRDGKKGAVFILYSQGSFSNHSKVRQDLGGHFDVPCTEVAFALAKLCCCEPNPSEESGKLSQQAMVKMILEADKPHKANGAIRKGALDFKHWDSISEAVMSRLMLNSMLNEDDMFRMVYNVLRRTNDFDPEAEVFIIECCSAEDVEKKQINTIWTCGMTVDDAFTHLVSFLHYLDFSVHFLTLCCFFFSDGCHGVQAD